MTIHTIERLVLCVLLTGATVPWPATQAVAGDFSNPTPYSSDNDRVKQDMAEQVRLSSGTGMLPTYYTLGDYYERYQNGANWNNAVLSGNTIILNGDNNSVTLTTGGSTVTQNSDGTCQTNSNTLLNSGGTADTAATACGTAP